MPQYIDKDAVLAEINKRLHQLTDAAFDSMIGRNLIEIRDFIDTLEVEEVDLEKKAIQLSQKYFPDEENIWARPNIEAQRCKSACIEMVECLKAYKGE